jgi:hypothetical protein
MTTVTLILAITANIVAVYTLLWCMSTSTEMLNIEDGLRECATRTRSNKIKLDTLDNKVNKPKRKAGRPKKNVKPKVVHQLNGKQ